MGTAAVVGGIMRNVKSVLLATLGLALSGVVVAPPPAMAAAALGAAFSGGGGTALVGGVVHARQGAPLTLTVTTDASTRCVEVLGAHAAKRTGDSGTTTWTFSFTAPTGDGEAVVTAVARSGFNTQGNCTGSASSSKTTTYVLDNTAPTVTGTRSPAANAAGWNKADTTVAWSVNDAGSGVGTGPTPTGSTQASETAGTAVTATATDRVGNVGAGELTLKVDKTAPTIRRTTSPSESGGLWHNTDVTVSHLCSDALSGVAGCSAPVTHTSEGLHQVSGTAVDVAGNSVGMHSVVRVDKTPPTLTGTPTHAPNDNGWYAGDVTVDWDATDELSGVDPAQLPADSTITGEGTGLIATATVGDRAGNPRTGSSAPVRIDHTPPVTGLVGDPGGWTNGAVTLTLDASDNLSQVDTTAYSVDGEPFRTGNSVVLDDEGEHTVRYRSTDRAGNVEPVRETTIRIDRTAPHIGHTFPTPTGYRDGTWTNRSVTVDFECTDGGSGVTSCTGDDTVAAEGSSDVTGTATDEAGNTATDTATVWIDSTEPTVTGTPDRAPNDNGWYDRDVTVAFACSDDRSGVADCQAPVTLGEGGDRSVTGRATDAAGNSAQDTVGGLRVDTTPPVLTASYASGWQRGDVEVDWSCTDALSGVASGPADDLVTGEGEDLSASATCTDLAGNVASRTVGAIMIDRHSPHTAATVPDPLPSGWYAGPVEVSLDASDALSGVATTRYSVDGGEARDYDGALTVTGPGEHTVRFWSVDVAGNVEDRTEADNVVSFSIDGNPPVTTLLDPIAPESGWFVECGIPVAFDVADPESGVAATYFRVDGGEVETYGAPFDRCLGDGTHTITYWSVDRAGNVEEQRDHRINVDTLPPTITGTASPAANAHGWNNTAVEVGFACTDTTPGSGVRVGEGGLAACGPDMTLANEGADQSASGEAHDVAGNTARTTVSGIDIDLTAPTLSGAPTTDANGAGWWRDDVVVGWSGDDELSGVDAGTAPADATVTGEGRGLGAGPVTVADRAGNLSEPASVSGIRIDRTAPRVEGAATTEPNAAGWFNSAVTVEFACDDPALADGTVGSGVAGCPTGELVAGDGADQHVTSGEATDVAGNVAPGVRVDGLDVDATAPTSTADNRCTTSNGWCTGTTATVVVSASDQEGLSGVQEIRYRIDGGEVRVASGDTASVTVPLDGSGEGTLTYWAVDHADNVERPNSVALKWDNIAPTVTHALSPEANADGWNSGDVTVSFDAEDDDRGSGVDRGTLTAPVTVTDETAGRVLTGTARDVAGNTASDSVTVRLDRTDPRIDARVLGGVLGSDGWYVGPVTVGFTCADDLSGVATCPGDVVLTDNGSNEAAGTATDRAGNTATATLGGIRIDREAPVVTRVDVEGKTYTFGAVPSPTCSATDAHSGVASCAVEVTGGTAGGVGTFHVTATATDRAGNTSTRTGSYRVVYRWDGFLQPVNDTAHQVGTTTSIFKAGSTVPMKLQLKRADGTIVQGTAAPTWLAPVRGGAMTAPVDESLYPVAADSGSAYRWDPTARHHHYNWKTESRGGHYWRVGVRLDDGQTYYVNIGLR